ncbi:MAG TPA: hypothetical protein VGQ55_08635, partial [Pyrinomonadaceae bacterium]|nr:hypothetical protein [Pyrinomonadaceae bacterium]
MFSQGTRTSGSVLIADIDDISVGVSVVERSAEAPVTICVAERMQLGVEDRSQTQSAAGISQLLEQCMDAVLKTYAGADAKHTPKSPSEIYCILRSPWTHFRTAQFEEKYQAPATITKDVIAALAKKALETPSQLDRSNILEAGVMQVFLNGYPTANPLGKKATRAMAIAFESDVNPEIRRAITDVCGKVLPGRTPIIHSGMRALLTVLHEHIPDIHRYVIVEIGGSVTDCSVIRKESVSQFAEIKEGSRTILKRVAKDGLPEEVVSQLRMIATDTCSSEACKNVKDALAASELDLAKSFGDAFGTLATARR